MTIYDLFPRNRATVDRNSVRVFMCQRFQLCSAAWMKQQEKFLNRTSFLTCLKIKEENVTIFHFNNIIFYVYSTCRIPVIMKNRLLPRFYNNWAYLPLPLMLLIFSFHGALEIHALGNSLMRVTAAASLVQKMWHLRRMKLFLPGFVCPSPIPFV